MGCNVTRHFEKLRTLKKMSMCVKFGTKSTHFEKKSFLQSTLISAILAHFKKIRKSNFAWLLFKTFKDNYQLWTWIDLFKLNVLSTILFIERSFVRVLKYTTQNWIGITEIFNFHDFYAPNIEDRGAYCFCPVCHSVILSSSLKL